MQRVLTHGSSRVVIALLCEAAKTKHFSVFITEGRGNGSGYVFVLYSLPPSRNQHCRSLCASCNDMFGSSLQTAEKLAETGIPTTVILDSAVGFYMEQTDMVIVGAEGVVENGGIVNSVGTYSAAVIAQALKKPFYVAAESYKFARLYPLTQRDVPQTQMELPVSGSLAKNDDALKNISLKNPFFDYTPPGYISLMFTDLGVLTPSAVSDELIKLYQ